MHIIQCERRIERERGTKNAKPTELGKCKSTGCILHTGTQPRSRQAQDEVEGLMQTIWLLRHPRNTPLKKDRAVRAQRGATAMLLRKSTFDLTENDSETQESFEDRITCRKVVWKDMILPLVSM